MKEGALLAMAEQQGLVGVVAVGVFGLQDDAAALLVGGLAAGTASAASGTSDPLVDGVIGGAAVAAAREAAAQAAGLPRRMLLAVTDIEIHVFDYPATRRITVFERKRTAVQITSFGLSRHVNLADGEQHLALTGSTAFYSPESLGDKLVIQLLS